MKVGVYQFYPEFGEKSKNLQKIEKAVKRTNAEIIVLPELCTTGYQFISRDELEKFCEPVKDGETVTRLSQICRENGCYLVAGIGEREGNIFYNSAVLVGPEGHIGTYRKVHLFYEEKKWFKPGDSGFLVWDIGKAKVGIMICFDWIFPESARSLALQGADIICHPANLVLPYCQNAMITRSIENRVFSITSNRTGSEKRKDNKGFTFTGMSQIVNHKGKVLFRLHRKTEKLKVVDIDPEMARDKQVTTENNLWNDRRTDFYKLKNNK
jgi:predicted amidohydrolase